MAADTKANFSRPKVVFPPSLLVLLPELACLSPDDSDYKSYTQQVELLVEQVKTMLVDLKSDVVQKVKLIYLLRRLGVSYHFETEIQYQLDQMFHTKTHVDDTHDYDLCTVSLIFQVFRQYGYKMPCDVFNKFKDVEGNFKDTLQKDVEGLLSLYEATHLAINGEDILDEALAYTTMHLKAILADKPSPRLAKHIAYALRQPYYKGMPLIESRRYISFYQEDDLCSDMLLKLTKLDTNRVQLLHQKEINEVLRWHKGLNYEEKLPYSRHRPIECYLWSMGTFFEPQYSIARIFLAKITILLTYMDDTYDAFGSPDELRCLTSAIQSWDINLMNEAPESMRILCRDILDLFREQENIFKNTGAAYDLSYAIEAVKGQFRYYQQEIEWLKDGYTPRYDEYILAAQLSTCYHVIAAVAFAGMTEVAGEKEFKWLRGFPKIDWATMLICRLMDDIVSTRREQEYKHIPTAIACYMKTHGVSIEETVEEFRRNIAKAWKDTNEEFIRTKSISRHLLTIFVNFSRIMDVLYKDNDSFTDTWHLKDCVKSLFVDVIPM